MKNNSSTNLLPIIYLIFGIYFMNFGIGYFVVPEYLVKVNNWIIAFGGALFLIAAYRSIVYSKKRIMHRMIKASK